MSRDSPVSVVALLRQSRKGRLNYDRHWTERNSSVERVVREVTGEMGGLGLGDAREPAHPAPKPAHTDSPVLKLTRVQTPRSHESSSVPLVLPVPASSPPREMRSPLTVVVKRGGERDVTNPRHIVMSLDSESSLVSPAMDRSKLDVSLDKSHHDLNSSVLSYDTPEIIKYKKLPRVDLPRLRLSTSLLEGRKPEEEEQIKEEAEKDESGDCSISSLESGSGDWEALVRYELQCREEAERRVAERRARWDAASSAREAAAREELSRARQQQQQDTDREGGGLVVPEQVEALLEERLRQQQADREMRQRALIIEARAEEDAARAARELRGRVREQTERLGPVHARVKAGLTGLLELWAGQQHQLGEERGRSVSSLAHQATQMLKEARAAVLEGNCAEEMFTKLSLVEAKLESTLASIQQEVTRLETEQKEQQKLQQEKVSKEAEAKKAAEAEAAAKEKEAAAADAESQAAPAPVPAPSAPIPAPVSTPAAPVPAPAATAPSEDTQAWHQSIVQFKADFIKGVTFTEAEKQFKFDLQKAVNTPLNSLSGVSAVHLQDKVDKLVALLSGQQVTVADRQVSTAQHPMARNFCMALAAKKLAKQGEEVVSSDAKLAFPAASLAVAVWDKFPEFGRLLLAYLFEFCPFLVPVHPQQAAGQSDRDYYTALGYRYEGTPAVIEKQDKYLKRMSGLARLHAALAVSHLPRASTTTLHPHPLSRLWAWLASTTALAPHTDTTATVLLDTLDVAGHALFTRYGKQFSKLVTLLHQQLLPRLEAVKSDGGPTARLEQFLSSAARAGSIREPEGIIKLGFL